MLLAYPPLGRARARRLAALPASRAAHRRARLGRRRPASSRARRAMRGARSASTWSWTSACIASERRTVDGAVALARHVSESDALDVRRASRSIRATSGKPMPEQDAALATARRDARSRARAVRRGRTSAARRERRIDARPLWRTHEVPGVTEMRPGTYVYNDRHDGRDRRLRLGRLRAHRARHGRLHGGPRPGGDRRRHQGARPRADARSPPARDSAQLLDRPDVVVARMSEEHGMLDLADTGWRPTVGDVVRVVPNHVCVVVHLHDVMYGVRGGRLERSWPIAARGRVQPVGVTPGALEMRGPSGIFLRRPPSTARRYRPPAGSDAQLPPFRRRRRGASRSRCERARARRCPVSRRDRMLPAARPLREAVRKLRPGARAQARRCDLRHVRRLARRAVAGVRGRRGARAARQGRRVVAQGECALALESRIPASPRRMRRALEADRDQALAGTARHHADGVRARGLLAPGAAACRRGISKDATRSSADPMAMRKKRSTRSTSARRKSRRGSRDAVIARH